MTLGETKISDYLRDLASASSTPGGGSAAALTAAQGAALLAMVCRLSIGKKKFADVEDEVRSILVTLDNDLKITQELADSDIRVFQTVIAAYKLPKETEFEAEARAGKIQYALKTCSEVPLELFKTCVSLLPLADRLEQICNPAVKSDVVVGRYLLLAALYSAQANVEINLAGITDDFFCAEKREYMEIRIREMKLHPI
ncbi:MAG: cyclodeaminase/cyclohydrolase family protein [Chlorobiaceae bacterium]|jgi:methenyltetrahydrofolate cyclohydrolase|nr:cyclodeaminase/cyclohydrolase family protein [Chlorobiaceae bacterium]